MKKVFITFLVAFLVLPAFIQWVPHGFVHAMQNHKTGHHQKTSQVKNVHNHDHQDSNSHNTRDQASTYHAVDLNFVTYFNDFLHIDLQRTDQTAIQSLAQEIQGIDISSLDNDLINYGFNAVFTQNRAPPGYDRSSLYLKPPLYLATKRLRI